MGPRGSAAPPPMPEPRLAIEDPDPTADELARARRARRRRVTREDLIIEPKAPGTNIPEPGADLAIPN